MKLTNLKISTDLIKKSNVLKYKHLNEKINIFL